MTAPAPADGLHGEGPGGALWGILDCARNDTLYPEVDKLGRDAVCLFAGPLAPVLKAAAPWLVRLREGSSLLARWRTEGRGQAWGLLFRSDSDIETLRRFFRQHLDTELPDGRKVLFRFYDPRVFWDHLSSCDSRQRDLWHLHSIKYIAANEITV